MFFSLTPLFSADWGSVDPADLAAKSPKVEKDAHAEAILWEVRVSDEAMGGYPHSVLTHYLKIKVFDDRGAEMVSKVDIPYIGKTSINQIAGRTTKADGTVIELKKDAVFDRVLVKLSGAKTEGKIVCATRSRTWGSRRIQVVRTSRRPAFANYLELQFQREIPVQTVRYFLKPLTNPTSPTPCAAWAFTFRRE